MAIIMVLMLQRVLLGFNTRMSENYSEVLAVFMVWEIAFIK